MHHSKELEETIPTISNTQYCQKMSYVPLEIRRRNVYYSYFSDDTCVDLTEFQASRTYAPAGVVEPMFHHFDHDNNGCISIADMAAEFHTVDHNST